MLHISRFLILAAILLGISGCTGTRDGSRSTWGLLTQKRHSSFQELRRTVKHLGGHNSWSDVGRTGRMFTHPGPGGFGTIARDLDRIFSPIFSLEGLDDTLRLMH